MIYAPTIGLVGVALVHAFALAAVGTAIGATRAVTSTRPSRSRRGSAARSPSADALGYMGSQILGGLAAGVTLRMIFTEVQWNASNLGSPRLSVSDGKGLLIEALLHVHPRPRRLGNRDRRSRTEERCAVHRVLARRDDPRRRSAHRNVVEPGPLSRDRGGRRRARRLVGLLRRAGHRRRAGRRAVQRRVWRRAFVLLEDGQGPDR